MNLRERTAELAQWAKGIAPRWYRVLKVTYLRRAQSSVNTMAAAIGFYALICIGPLGLLAAWSLQLVVGPGDQSYKWLQRAVNRVAGQAAGAVMDQIDALLTNPNAHIAGVFSFLLLVWAGLRLFESLEISLTEIWPHKQDRGLIARKLVALGSMAGAGLLFLVAILLTAFLPTVIQMLDRVTPIHLSHLVVLQPVIRVSAEVAIAFAAFFLLFKFIPVQPVPTRVAAIGALFAGGAWRAVTPIFTLTVARSARDSAIYGGLAGVVMFLTWAFISAQALLLGAHIAAAYEHVVYERKPQSEDDDFIHMRTVEEGEDPREDATEFRGPRTYPPPGHV